MAKTKHSCPNCKGTGKVPAPSTYPPRSSRYLYDIPCPVCGPRRKALAEKKARETLIRLKLPQAGIAMHREAPCEKCGKVTHWTVFVVDRWAYWCGCPN